MCKRISVCLMVAAAVMFLPEDALAQKHRVEITPYDGYKWSNSVNVTVEDEQGAETNEDVKLEVGGSYGVTVDFNVNESVAIEAGITLAF